MVSYHHLALEDVMSRCFWTQRVVVLINDHGLDDGMTSSCSDVARLLTEVSFGLGGEGWGSRQHMLNLVGSHKVVDRLY
jgi:hypothetical protein